MNINIGHLYESCDLNSNLDVVFVVDRTILRGYECEYQSDFIKEFLFRIVNDNINNNFARISVVTFDTCSVTTHIDLDETPRARDILEVINFCVESDIGGESIVTEDGSCDKCLEGFSFAMDQFRRSYRRQRKQVIIYIVNGACDAGICSEWSQQIKVNPQRPMIYMLNVGDGIYNQNGCIYDKVLNANNIGDFYGDRQLFSELMLDVCSDKVEYRQSDPFGREAAGIDVQSDNTQKNDEAFSVNRLIDQQRRADNNDENRDRSGVRGETGGEFDGEGGEEGQGSNGNNNSGNSGIGNNVGSDSRFSNNAGFSGNGNNGFSGPPQGNGNFGFSSNAPVNGGGNGFSGPPSGFGGSGNGGFSPNAGFASNNNNNNNNNGNNNGNNNDNNDRFSGRNNVGFSQNSGFNNNINNNNNNNDNSGTNNNRFGSNSGFNNNINNDNNDNTGSNNNRFGSNTGFNNNNQFNNNNNDNTGGNNNRFGSNTGFGSTIANDDTNAGNNDRFNFNTGNRFGNMNNRETDSGENFGFGNRNGFGDRSGFGNTIGNDNPTSTTNNRGGFGRDTTNTDINAKNNRLRALGLPSFIRLLPGGNNINDVGGGEVSVDSAETTNNGFGAGLRIQARSEQPGLRVQQRREGAGYRGELYGDPNNVYVNGQSPESEEIDLSTFNNRQSPFSNNQNPFADKLNDDDDEFGFNRGTGIERKSLREQELERQAEEERLRKEEEERRQREIDEYNKNTLSPEERERKRNEERDRRMNGGEIDENEGETGNGNTGVNVGSLILNKNNDFSNGNDGEMDTGRPDPNAPIQARETNKYQNSYSAKSRNENSSNNRSENRSEGTSTSRVIEGE